MLFQISKEPLGVVENPLTTSLFVATFDEVGFPIPPASAFRITDSGDLRITDSFDKRITDS